MVKTVIAAYGDGHKCNCCFRPREQIMIPSLVCMRIIVFTIAMMISQNLLVRYLENITVKQVDVSTIILISLIS